MSGECCLVFFPSRQQYLVEPRSEIQLVNQHDCATSSKNSSIMGNGNLLLMVRAFKNLQSTQKRQVPSFFLIRTTEEEKGLQLGLIMPSFNRHLILNFCLECRRISVRPDHKRLGSKGERYGMVTCSGWWKAYWFIKDSTVFV